MALTNNYKRKRNFLHLICLLITVGILCIHIPITAHASEDTGSQSGPTYKQKQHSDITEMLIEESINAIHRLSSRCCHIATASPHYV